jgi:phosphoribosylcarboxyaminoimidazole (NCAIR) mutase
LFTADFFIDVDAVLKYLRVIGGSAGTAMEIGGFVTAATVVPLLAMGMSIDDDEMRRE